MSPPTRFGQIYQEEIRIASNISTHLYANVVNISTTPDATSVTGVDVSTLEGNKFVVKARAFILATGALENARILLVSNQVQPQGLGNAHDLVGRFFMEHLNVPGGLMLPLQPTLNIEFYNRRHLQDRVGQGYLALSADTLRDEGLLNVNAYVESVPLEELARGTTGWSHSAGSILHELRQGKTPINFAGHLGNIISHLDEVVLDTYHHVFHPVSSSGFSLNYYIEHAPNRESRVTLTSDKDKLGMPRIQLDWRFGELEKRAMRRANEIIAEEVGRAGIGRVAMVPDDPHTGWPRGLRGAWHQMGTTRMHAAPTHGVVDADCRVHGMANLYIAGSSVFPTSSYTTPTLTVVALSLRLADHIAALMR
jgi:choline dehydrogenase-like flavoprotein